MTALGCAFLTALIYIGCKFGGINVFELYVVLFLSYIAFMLHDPHYPKTNYSISLRYKNDDPYNTKD